jgi:hypothetical protein
LCRDFTRVRWRSSADRGQHRQAVTVALPTAHRQLVHPEVHILHAEAQRLHQPQPRAVEEQCHQPRRALHPVEHRAHFLSRHHLRQALRTARANDVGDPGHGIAQDVHIQEEKRGQRLARGARGHVLVGGEMRQELAHLPLA